MEYFIAIIIRVLSKLSKFLFEIGLKYIMLPEEYGKFILLLSHVLIISTFLNLGINNYIIKNFSSFNNEEKKEYFSLIILVNIFLYIIIAILRLFIKIDIDIILIATLISICGIIAAILQSQFKITFSMFYLELEWYIIFFIILLFFNNYKNYFFIKQVYIISLIINVLLGFKYIHINKLLKLKIKLLKIKEIFYSSFSTLFMGIAYTILSRMDILMLKKYVNTSELGDYNIIARTCVQLLFFLQIIISTYIPRIAKTIKSKNIVNINNQNKLVIKIAILTTSIMIFLFIIFTNFFNIYSFLKIDSKYINLINIFILEKLIYSYICLNSYILYYLNKEKIIYLNSILIIVINFLLNKLMITNYGVIGAGISTSITIFLSHLLETLEIYILEHDISKGILDKKNAILLIINLLFILSYFYLKNILIIIIGINLDALFLIKERKKFYYVTKNKK